jgi:nucleotide-binding universal stress UspA family protein
MLQITRILCPTDFSEASYAALETACEMGVHFGASLRLLHVVPFSPPFPTDLMVVAVASAAESDQERMDFAAQRLKEIMATRVPAELPVEADVKMGMADHEIVSAAEDTGSDLIVISTHGLTGWRHLAFGSVAESIVRRAHCPVLTIRALKGT